MLVVDTRGLTCPEPVIRTKKALAEMSGGSLVCLVDNPISRENVVKFARSQGCDVSVSEAQGVYHITVVKGTEEHGGRLSEIAEQPQKMPEADSTVYLITADELGRGDSRLGQTLMKSYLYALSESDHVGQQLIFLNAGAKLTCQESECLQSLERLVAKGFVVKTCGLCLDFYGLKEKLAVGEVTNMYAILEAMGKATKVITV